MEYHIDAKNKVLGRVATDISLILQGKKSATFERNRVSDDKVYVSNVRWHRRHGQEGHGQDLLQAHGYVGHLKEKSFEQHMAKDPRFVLRHAVRKMLPAQFPHAEAHEEFDIRGTGRRPKNAGKRVRPVKQQRKEVAK